MKFPSFVLAVPVLVLAAACGGGGGSGGNQAVMESKSLLVGPSGGLVMLPDGTSVSIPQGALSHDVTITVETHADAQPVPGVRSTGLTYLFSPEGQHFNVPVTVTIAVDSSLIPTGESTSDVTIFTAPRNTSNYLTLPTSAADTLHVTAQTTHFSDVTSAAYTPGKVNPDDPMSDADFTGGQDVTVDQVNDFFKKKGSALYGWKDPASGKIAAEAIVTAATMNGLNPVYILARLESESGLIEGSNAWSPSKLADHLSCATGCDCPDSVGFHAQIECAATTIAKDFHKQVGGGVIKGWGIRVHATTQDGCPVTPANAATAALYTSTPYEGSKYSSTYCSSAIDGLKPVGETSAVITEKITLLQAEQYAHAAGVPCETRDVTGYHSLAVAGAVAEAESSLCTNSIGGGGMGLWQIQASEHDALTGTCHIKDSGTCSGVATCTGGNWTNPSVNAGWMANLSDNGKNYEPWCTYGTCCDTGCASPPYKQFIAAAEAAYTSVCSAPPPSTSVTELAWLFYQYAQSFPGSITLGSTSPPCSGASLGQSIANLAKLNLGNTACGPNVIAPGQSQGIGYFTPTTSGGNVNGANSTSSCNGCGTKFPEWWCADFATWVWAQSGVGDTEALGAEASQFATYGHSNNTTKAQAEVGDAVVFPEHVAIVVKTYLKGDLAGYIETVSGDWWPANKPGGNANCDDCTTCEYDFANYSQVVLNPAYPGRVCDALDLDCRAAQNKVMGALVTAIVAPVGGSPTSCKATDTTPSRSPSPPSGGSNKDVCCATCVGQSTAYYAMQVPFPDGGLPTCDQAAQTFCQAFFSDGYRSAEISDCNVYTGPVENPGGGGDGGTTSSSGSCALGGKTYPINTCTETMQCNGSTWVARSGDASGCLPSAACLTDSGQTAIQNDCTSTLQCDDGVWVDRFDDPALCNCLLAGTDYPSNTCTETLQCDDGDWIERDSDPSSCDTGVESSGGCLTDKGAVVPQNTCTSTLQCQNGVWVDRDDDPSHCL
jgi:hypothetical protein